ncbi:hypothetical protein [Rossellomorea sp. BNER]|uniref:hypothetical protein n=1 Tax=Rossellomorea sp. BNER TaxID=2962031 RepID=UPI003AF1EF80|nr:hypothetical protein [Rossellomorea sp. BNER]
MKVLEFHRTKEEKGINNEESITIEDIKTWSKDDVLDHLQCCIDWLTEEKLYSDNWHFFRNHIDDIVAILDDRMKH